MSRNLGETDQSWNWWFMYWQFFYVLAILDIKIMYTGPRVEHKQMNCNLGETDES